MSLFLSLVLLVTHVFSKSDFSLRSLKDASSLEISTTADSPRLWVVFKKDCGACRKQIMDLQCIDQKLFPVYLIGVKSTEQSLRKEYKKFKTKTPAIYGDKELRSYFKFEGDITPEIIIEYKGILKKHIGRLACSRLLSALEAIRE